MDAIASVSKMDAVEIGSYRGFAITARLNAARDVPRAVHVLSIANFSSGPMDTPPWVCYNAVYPRSRAYSNFIYLFPSKGIETTRYLVVPCPFLLFSGKKGSLKKGENPT